MQNEEKLLNIRALLNLINLPFGILKLQLLARNLKEAHNEEKKIINLNELSQFY